MLKEASPALHTRRCVRISEGPRRHHYNDKPEQCYAALTDAKDSTMTTDTEAGPVAQAPATRQAAEDVSIRPFTVHVPEAKLQDLRRRIAATQWPEKETVADDSQGVPLALMQDVSRYWATEYDWRKVEARLNALPQFITKIDGLDIHFIHVRSKHANALPVIVTHGWPGSIIHQLKIVDPLVNPTAHGGSAADAFDVVFPSMPGFGFSGRPDKAGWDPARTARAWLALMKRLGYTKFVAQGGDWGAIVTDVMATQGHPELVGIHTNMPGAVPPDVSKAIATGGPAPSGLSDEESRAFQKLKNLFATGVYYAFEMATRPQTLYGIADSPSAWRPGSSTLVTAMPSRRRRPLRRCARPRKANRGTYSRETTCSTTSRCSG